MQSYKNVSKLNCKLKLSLHIESLEMLHGFRNTQGTITFLSSFSLHILCFCLIASMSFGIKIFPFVFSEDLFSLRKHGITPQGQDFNHRSMKNAESVYWE